MQPMAFLKGTPTILNGLSFAYNCDEASGNLIDGLGVSNLTATNAPGTAAGLISTSRTFTIAGNKFFYATSPAVLTTSADFSVSLWMFSTDAANFVTPQTLIANLDSGVNGGYCLFAHQIAGSFNLTFRTQDAAGAVSDLNLAPADAPLNNWVWLYFEWNSVTGRKTLRYKRPSGPVSVVAGPSIPAGVPGPSTPRGLEISGSGVAGTFEGRMDCIYGWSTRILTSVEQTFIYNGGVGIQFPFQ